VKHTARTNVSLETWADMGIPPAEDGSNSRGRTRAIFDRWIRLETQHSKRYTASMGAMWVRRGWEVKVACRGSVVPLNKQICNLNADDFEYALAA
jgi:hypothetical protein